MKIYFSFLIFFLMQFGYVNSQTAIDYDFIKIKKDSSFHVYIYYKIPTEKFQFNTNGNDVSVEYEHTFEVYKKDSIVTSIIKTDLIKLDNSVYTGLVDFILEKGEYNLKTIFSIGDRTYSQKPVVLEVEDSTLTKAFFFVDKKFYSTTKIPFTNKEVFAVFIKEDSTAKAQLFQNDKVLDLLPTTEITREKFSSNLKIDLNSDAIMYLVTDFNKKIQPGKFSIQFDVDENQKNIFNCDWINFPELLKNEQIAKMTLKKIFTNEELEILNKKNEKENNYQNLFLGLWGKYDPTKETAFNEILDEYFARFNFVNDNYSTTNKKIGVLTDRGQIYLSFGKPQKIERSYTKRGKAVEIWQYPKTKYYFLDENGLNEYKLIKTND